MAAKVGKLIGGSETATTFCITNSNSNSNSNSRTSICASNTISSIIQEKRKYSLRIGIRHFSTPPPSLVVSATSGSNSNEPDSPLPSTFQDELKYLLKLVIGSILGAAVIKYGSAAIPTITRPDITVALSIISTPSVIAVLLLARESREH